MSSSINLINITLKRMNFFLIYVLFWSNLCIKALLT